MTTEQSIMTNQQPNGHGRKQMRWRSFDYSTKGVYFVTIVTYQRLCLFGQVVHGEMILNDAGSMILEQYNEMSNTTIQCMDVVVMPNHIHFMVSILHGSMTSLPTLIKKFKSKTTVQYLKGMKTNHWLPIERHLWQRSYWDDIVWNDRMFDFIRHYIVLNPRRWDKDALNEGHGNELDDINGSLRKLR